MLLNADVLVAASIQIRKQTTAIVFCKKNLAPILGAACTWYCPSCGSHPLEYP